MQRSGALYSAQPKEHSPLFYELKDWIDSHFDEEEQAEPDVQEAVSREPDIQAMYHETIRRLSDPSHEPFVLRHHPLAPEKIEDTKALFRMLSDERQDRLLTIFEQIVSMPEPEMERALDFVLAALTVVEEMAA